MPVEAPRRTFNIQSYNYMIYTKKSPRRHLGDDSAHDMYLMLPPMNTNRWIKEA